MQLLSNRKSARLGLAVIAATALLAAPVLAADTTQKIRVRVGGHATIALNENPSTGYSWKYNPAESIHAAWIEVADGGHIAGRPIPGAPGTHIYKITGLHRGGAVAVFDYARPWEPVPPIARHKVIVRIY